MYEPQIFSHNLENKIPSDTYREVIADLPLVRALLQAFQWILCAQAINCPCKEVFSKLAWAIYCPP